MMFHMYVCRALSRCRCALIKLIFFSFIREARNSLKAKARIAGENVQQRTRFHVAIISQFV